MTYFLIAAFLIGAIVLGGMGIWMVSVPLALVGAAIVIFSVMARGSEGATPMVGGEAPEPTGMPRAAGGGDAETANERVGQA